MSIVDLPLAWRGRALVVESIDGELERWFSDDELATARAFEREKRRDEWLLSRYAIKRLAVQRGVAGDPRLLAINRPRLANGMYISISHSRGVAAAAIDDAPVGIDVERLRDLDEHVAKHFMTEDEIASMQQCAITHRVLHWWCAKEAAWKQQGGEIRFLKQIPLKLKAESAAALRFGNVETVAVGDYIVALTLP
jgi:phosphopantetheinyl transferase